MQSKLFKVFFAFALVLSMTACNLPLGQQPTLDNSAMGTIVAQDVLLTQIGATLAASGSQSLPAPVATSLPPEILPTPTVTLTPLPLATPTPQGVWLTINQNSNCRVGPATYHKLVTTLKIGDKVEVVGRDPNNEYFYVRVPNSASGFCWVWRQYTSVQGDIGILPVFTPQPTPTMTMTPTPAPEFLLSYNSFTTCGGEYALRLFIRNTGGITWQSIQIVITDSSTGSTFTNTSDTFKSYNGCNKDMEQADLTPGEEGFVSNAAAGSFGYNPSGHHLTVTVTLFTENALRGSTASQTISVTP